MTPPETALSARAAKYIHADQKFEAAKEILDFFKVAVKLPDDKPTEIESVLVHFLHHCLNNGGMVEAASLLWTKNQFTAEPQSVRDLWQFFDEASMGLIMGAAKMGKSFSLTVRLYLEWLRDLEYTGVCVIGPSAQHLAANCFSHMVSLHTRAALKMPGKYGDLFIGLSRRNQLGSIRGVVIPKGAVKKAGRLQGVHRKPRPQPHPVFGVLSRLFILIDEIENVDGGIWGDVDNVLSEVEECPGNFKLFGSYNPTQRHDEVAKRAEPAFGWEMLDADKHFRWKSVRGWDVLRIDAHRCENVVQGKIIYPGFQTKEGLEAIARNAGGTSAPGYLSMCRAMYPSQGADLVVIPPGMFSKWRGQYIWLDEPTPVGSCDLALEGGASAVFTLGKFGKATGIKWPASIEYPEGRTVMFKDGSGNVAPRWGLLAEQQLVLPKGDTMAIKSKIIEICRKSGIKPEFFCCDRTGAGAGIADLIKYEWSSQICDLNYSSGASKSKLMAEDTKDCWELYDRIGTELWFALRAWGEFQYLLLAPSLDLSNLTQPITQRQFKVGTKNKVEAKRDYQLRTGKESPDEADSLTLLVHAARKGSGLVPSMKGDSVDENSEDDWYDEVGYRIDFTNKTEVLDEVT